MVAEHGESKYRNDSCRCEVCTKGNAQAAADGRIRRAAEIADFDGARPAKHNRNTYKNWGCRCADCTADNAALMRERRARQ